jgi:uncharacterized protein YdeI (YjbR/CyaY-like superfamily)
MHAPDPRVDAYIGEAAPFAKPILTHLRRLVHTACPEVRETIKWGMPTFEYHGILCHLAAFKAHCAFGFWNRELKIENASDEAMGQFGRIAALVDLPHDKVLLELVKEAARLNEAGKKAGRPAERPVPPELPLPPLLAAALKKNAAARAAFEGFSPSHRREYIEWISDAKRDETRARRVATAIEWLEAGKPRNWKYEGR